MFSESQPGDKIHKLLFFFFPPCCAACGILLIVPQPGTKPVPPALEAGSPNHWNTREVPLTPLTVFKISVKSTKENSRNWNEKHQILQFRLENHRMSDSVGIFASFLSTKLNLCHEYLGRCGLPFHGSSHMIPNRFFASGVQLQVLSRRRWWRVMRISWSPIKYVYSVSQKHGNKT